MCLNCLEGQHWIDTTYVVLKQRHQQPLFFSQNCNTHPLGHCSSICHQLIGRRLSVDATVQPEKLCDACVEASAWSAEVEKHAPSSHCTCAKFADRWSPLEEETLWHVGRCETMRLHPESLRPTFDMEPYPASWSHEGSSMRQDLPNSNYAKLRS